MKPGLVLWGAAGQAVVLYEFLRHEYELLALVDNRDVPSPIAEVPVLRGAPELKRWLAGRSPQALHFGVAIGGEHGRDRLSLAAAMEELGLSSIRAVHPTAIVTSTAELADSVQVLPGATICAGAWIGPSVIINSRALVEHQSRVGAGSHVGPGAVICGEVEIGENVFVGAGSVVLPKLCIDSDVIIGAGSVVTTNLPAGVVAYGSPATIRRKV